MNLALKARVTPGRCHFSKLLTCGTSIMCVQVYSFLYGCATVGYLIDFLP